MASNLRVAPEREIATDDDNHGLGPTKSNVAPVVDPVHELDAREEELLREWTRRLARAVGVEGIEDDAWYGSLPADGRVRSLLDAVGRWLPRGEHLRWLDHFDDVVLNERWGDVGSVVAVGDAAGGLLSITRSAGVSGVSAKARACDPYGANEIEVVCIPSWTPTSDDGSNYGIMLSVEDLGSGPSNYAILCWDGSAGVNEWRLRYVLGGVTQLNKTVAAAPPAANMPLRLRLSMEADGGQVTVTGRVGTATAVGMSSSLLPSTFRPAIYVAPTSPGGAALLVDYALLRVRVALLAGLEV